jgi:lipoprotein-anchoring transpeptidase ErfK/SrfK
MGDARFFSEWAFEKFILDYVQIKYPQKQFKEFIYIGVERQKLFFFKENKVIKSFDVSTSKYGAGTKAGSEQTPIGLHIIKSMHGHNVPVGGVFLSKKFTGKIVPIESSPIPTGKDDITTRVLSLAGVEPGVNKGGALDSYERHIYIHGTAEEGLIGQPASHGCIRMRNHDIIDLFDLVYEGLPVLILNN